MEVDYLFFAHTADLDNKNLFIVTGGGWDEFNMPRYPVYVPVLHFVTRLKISPSELNKSHAMRVELLDPHGRNVLLRGDFEITTDPVKRVFTLTMGLGDITFPEPGTYQFRLLANGRVIGKQPIKANLATDAEPDGWLGRVVNTA